MNRVYIQKIHSAKSSAASIVVSHRKANRFKGAYITDIDNTAIFTLEDAINQFADLCPRKVSEFTMTLAQEPKNTLAMTCRKAEEIELKLEALYLNDYNPLDLELSFPDEVETLLADPLIIAQIQAHLDPETLTPLSVRALQSEAITPEERALPSFTWRHLWTLPNWLDWEAAEYKQLDQFESLGMFGAACYPPPDAMILNPVWGTRIKLDGTRCH